MALKLKMLEIYSSLVIFSVLGKEVSCNSETSAKPK